MVSAGVPGPPTAVFAFTVVVLAALVVVPVSAVPPDEVDPSLFAPRRSVAKPAEPVDSEDSAAQRSAVTTGELSNTGADRCDGAIVIDVPVGPPGFPATITTTGRSIDPTGPDCPSRVGRGWWEAFRIDRCARVTVDFCGTRVFRATPPLILAGSCNPGVSCGPVFPAAASSNQACPGNDGPCVDRDGCVDRNLWIDFGVISAGTYYYPVENDFPSILTSPPYRLNITAEECAGDCPGCRGACCDAARRTCQDDVHQDDCDAAPARWFHRAQCCGIECRPADLDFDAESVELLGHVPVQAFPSGSTLANDVWGYVSPSGREYAILGLTHGTGFVEITNPRNPVIVGDVPDAPSIWSDMAVFEGYVYNVNENRAEPTGMQIIDVTRIDDGAVKLVGSARGGLTSAHNVFVNPVSRYAYACASNLARGFLAYDLENPADPFPAGVWDEALAHDIYVITYAQCPWTGRTGLCEIAFVFAGGDGVKIVDVTNKNAMTTIATHGYPTAAFTHQGWLTDDRRHLVFGDEFDESRFDLPATSYVIDVQDPSQPAAVTTFTAGLCVTDHNLYVRGPFVFEANYAGGLHVFDIGNLPEVTLAGRFDTHPEDNDRSFNGAWGVFAGFPSGVVVLSDRQRGLFILSLCDPQSRADVNGNGRVSLRDVARVMNCFSPGRIAAGCFSGDLDCNREVNGKDLSVLIAAMNAGNGPIPSLTQRPQGRSAPKRSRGDFRPVLPPE